ncbi:aromatic ring-hydroxylating dioxygenase subunit alpha [Pseudomonas sp. NPDC089752]|uniref:aromatic ring-hydroxylating oxygenase subunit alpha n=1 Tax=Pseudomonas sp. NPDC089752 TaxID=3364472 RepID=UPI0037F2D5A4
MDRNKTVYDLIAQRKANHSLPGVLYSNDAVYQEDLAQIWHKDWIFVGHTFEIEKPGQFITVQIGNYPVVVVRGKDGEVRAFHNACRHRGAKVCEASQGKVAKLVCPYHKWTFELDGKLLFAGNMAEDFDKSQYNLKPAHCEVANTYIYVSVGAVKPDFNGFREALHPFVNPHNLEDCKVAFESNIIEKGNWKLVFENNRECYHCDGSHPELMNSFVDNLSVGGVGGDEDPQLAAFWNQCEAGGMPSRLLLDKNGRYRITRIPLSSGAVSYTMDGKPAVNGRLDKTGIPDIGALLYFNYPSTWNHFLGDHALSFRVLPISATETLVTTKWLVPKAATEGIDYEIDRLTKVWIATNDQDRVLVEGTQVGVTSPTYEPGPLSATAETGVCQFVDWYCATMLDRLQDPVLLRSVG